MDSEKLTSAPALAGSATSPIANVGAGQTDTSGDNANTSKAAASPHHQNDTRSLLLDSKDTAAAVQAGDGSRGAGVGAPRTAKEAKTQSEREPTTKDFFRVFSYAKKLDFFFIFAGCLSSVGAGVTMPLMNVVFGALVGSFSIGAGTDPAAFQGNVNTQSLYMFILFLARFALNYVSKFCFRMISARMSAAIRLHYLTCLFGQTIHVLDSMPSGAAASTITTTANTLQLGISENLGTFIEFSSTILAGVIVAFTYSWLLTLVISCVLFYILLIVAILMPFVVKAESKLTGAETVANSIAAESFGNIRMLMACGAETKMARRYNEWVQKARRYGHRMGPLMATMFGTVFFSLYATFALAFWYGMKLFHDGRIHSVSTVIVVVMSVMTTVVSVERVATPLISASKAMVAAAEFFAVIDAPRPESGRLAAPDVSATEDIVFSGVDFAYPGRPHVKVLDDLNVRIAAGKVNAIVGPSGSGKSTIIGLVERWYSLQNEQHVIAKTANKEKEAEQKKQEEKAKKEKETRKREEKKKNKERRSETDEAGDQKQDKDNAKPSPLLGQDNDDDNDANLPAIALKGSVRTCGRSLDEIDVKWWRSQIGLVQQEPFLFNDTIYNNVAFGLVGSVYEGVSNDEKRTLVEEACREAFADEFIDRLPDQYETRVGESGAKLSGGQRQRIAIARSIVKKPKILMLDEATSAIDVRSERIVQAALDKVSRNRTTITVAHRLSTIKSADKIIVMQKGRCVEEGTHEGLLANESGVYRGLVQAQQLSLGDERTGQNIAETNTDLVVGEKEDVSDDNAMVATSTKERHVKAGSEASDTSGDAGSRPQSSSRAADRLAGAPVWKNHNIVTGFGRLLYEQRSRFPYYITLLLVAMGAGSASPIQAYLFAKLVVIFGEFSNIVSGSVTTLSEDQVVHDSNFFALMFFIMALGTGACYFVMGLASAIVEHFVCAAYRQQYFEAIIQQRIAFFDDEENASGTLTNRVGSDPKQLRELLGANLTMALTAVFTIAGSLIVSFVFGWKLALLAFAVTVPLVLVAGFYRMRYEIEFVNMNAAVFAESSKWAAESIDAFRTVTALTLEDVICKRYEALLSNHVLDAYKKARFKTLVYALSNSISLGCQALIFWYGGRLVASGEYQVTGFFVCYMAAIQGAESAGQGLSFLPNAAQVTAAANRILNIRKTKNIDRVPLSESIPDTDDDADARLGNRGASIELRNVHFRYPTRNVPIFRGIDLTIERGKFTAIVGASGSGKTSIISLLERFYDVERGAILCNGRDISEVNVQTYRKLLSLVAQEAALFQGTVRENVTLGVEDGSISEEEMIQACRDASIHDFIISLPDGYDTDLGNRGVSLSGGQKQRLAIARALLRNPRILLLDEATSSLDSDTEKLIQATFERVSQGRTTVAVAHRLSTIQKADTIYVLGDGEVLEKGSHSGLLKQRGVYWSMCQSQALDK